MNKSKIKKQLKANNNWDQYKNDLNKNFRFITSKIAFIFNNKISLNKLVDIELKVAKSKKDNDKSFKYIIQKHASDSNIDWNSLESFLWYIYKTASYKADKKNGTNNIFITDPIKGNSLKREYFDKWLTSLSFDSKEVNEKVKKLLKVVF